MAVPPPSSSISTGSSASIVPSGGAAQPQPLPTIQNYEGHSFIPQPQNLQTQINKSQELAKFNLQVGQEVTSLSTKIHKYEQMYTTLKTTEFETTDQIAKAIQDCKEIQQKINEFKLQRSDKEKLQNTIQTQRAAVQDSIILNPQALLTNTTLEQRKELFFKDRAGAQLFNKLVEKDPRVAMQLLASMGVDNAEEISKHLLQHLDVPARTNIAMACISYCVQNQPKETLLRSDGVLETFLASFQRSFETNNQLISLFRGEQRGIFPDQNINLDPKKESEPALKSLFQEIDDNKGVIPEKSQGSGPHTELLKRREATTQTVASTLSLVKNETAKPENASSVRFPPELLQSYRHLFKEISDKHGPEVAAFQVANFIFLRLLTPAYKESLSPLTSGNVDNLRKMTALLKLVQDTGNNAQEVKEGVMAFTKGPGGFIDRQQPVIHQIMHNILPDLF